ncbi:MAG: methylenetetrahydrofolate reductase C-terminal domain-containing protein [Limisphaerales bacterium]
MIAKTVARVEAFFKGMMFDCHACGQCVLSQTALICPMSCPKGLRNGPCGGTLNGECEVYPDKQCVWVRIHRRTARGSLACPALLPSPDARLFNTSSYLNHLAGTDYAARQPLPYLPAEQPRTRQPVQTQSELEKRLKRGVFVKTCELRAPRDSDLGKLARDVRIVNNHFDAVNATAYLNAKPTLASPVVAAKLVELGMEAVCQSTCRDHTKTTFIAELLQNQINNVHNVLCLTGDSYAGIPKIKQVFDMDSSLMIYEARHLRERGLVHFTGQKIDNPPKLFLGAAINPFTSPTYIPILRLKQKIMAGADFIQTQIIFDVPRFAAFMETVRNEGLHDEVFIIAGIPVVTSAAAIPVLSKMPGVHLPDDVLHRLREAPVLSSAGLALAAELISQVRRIPGVRGVHLMLFGSDHSVLPELVDDIDTEPNFHRTH